MRKGLGLLVLVPILALLVTACGPQMATPTPQGEEVVKADPTGAHAEEGNPAEAAPESEEEEGQAPTEAPEEEPGSPPQDLPVDENDWRALGSPDAPVTIVEYSDFQWPFCAKYVRETFPQIVDRYVETGKVRYEFVNFPLNSIHPQAQLAAEAAECAGELGGYWEYHDALFESQDRWSGQANPGDLFKELAGQAGLDQAKFDACLDEGRYSDKVMEDLQAGSAQGITGTPAFRINGAALSGALPFESFKQQIDFFLAGGEPPSLLVSADSFRSLGEPDAPVVVTEFSDFQWPACASVARGVIPELKKQYVDTGKVRFVFREFPLSSHPNAQKASEAAICAGLQDSYWEMNEHLFDTAEDWSAESDPTGKLKAYAKELGLDTNAFNECLDSGEAEITVQGDLLAGQAAGVNATPYFFVNNIPIRGGLPIESLGRIIDYAALGGEMPSIEPPPGDWRNLGDVQAQAKMVALVDFANPDSAQHAAEVLPQLADVYINSGQLLYIIQPWSEAVDSVGAQAAAAAECAGQQDLYWEMHEQLLTNQATWTDASDPGPVFIELARSVGADAAGFEDCLGSEWAAIRAESGSVIASLYGIPGAPVFLFNNGQGLEGSPSFEEFQAVVESILNQ